MFALVSNFTYIVPEGNQQNVQSGITLPCLPICISLYHFGPNWSEVTEQLPDNSSGIKNDFCSIWAEVKIVSYRF